MRKIIIGMIFLLPLAVATAQIKDTTAAMALAKRCLNFDETKIDSLRYYANQLQIFGNKHDFKVAISDALRLNGMVYEYLGNYDSAVYFYLHNMDYAKQQQLSPKKIAGLYTDLISVYKVTKQFNKAKECALLMLNASTRLKDSARMSSAYNNLGMLYRNLKQKDSAIICYDEAIKLKTLLKDSAGMSSLRVNLSSYYYNNGEFEKAHQTILPNIPYHLAHDEKGDLWYDYTSAATALVGLKNYGEAEHYLDLSSVLIDSTAKDKLAQTYRIYSELYRMQGNYKGAFEFLDRASDLEKEFIGEDNSRIIAEAREKFETEKKEKDNIQLSAQVLEQKLQKRNVSIMAVIAVSLVLIIGIGFWQKQRSNKKLQLKNYIINRQVEKMEELNLEKNSLISIVSHDLGSPFGNIHIWSQVLESKTDGLSDKQKEAIGHIKESTKYGQQLIRNILDVEKAGSGDMKLHLEKLDLKKLLSTIVENNQSSALEKKQQIHLRATSDISVLSDRQMIERICGNLISNAIKYSGPGKNIFVSLRDEDNHAVIEIKDEGVGIPADELPMLFTKYSRISSQPTAGEVSTGLGLSIVKRLVDELNGKITVQSRLGEGSTFIVTLSY